MARFHLTLALRAPPRGKPGPAGPRCPVVDHEAKSLDELLIDLHNQQFLKAAEVHFDGENKVKRTVPVLIATAHIVSAGNWREAKHASAEKPLPPDLSAFTRTQKDATT